MATDNGIYNKATISDGNETTVLNISRWKAANRGRGATFYVRASLAGTLKIYFIDRDGVTTGNELKSESLTADTLTAVDFDLAVPRYLATFTRSGGGTGTCAVEVFDY